jgi:hypothetical protein
MHELFGNIFDFFTYVFLTIAMHGCMCHHYGVYRI